MMGSGELFVHVILEKMILVSSAGCLITGWLDFGNIFNRCIVLGGSTS